MDQRAAQHARGLEDLRRSVEPRRAGGGVDVRSGADWLEALGYLGNERLVHAVCRQLEDVIEHLFDRWRRAGLDATEGLGASCRRGDAPLSTRGTSVGLRLFVRESSALLRC